MTITPNTLTFTALPNPAPTQTAVLAESSYTGVLHLTGSACTPGSGNTTQNVAIVSPQTGNGPSLTETVTAQGAGNCDFTFSDTSGHSVTLHVDVTTTSVIIHLKKRPIELRPRPVASAAPTAAPTPAPRPRPGPLRPLPPVPAPGGAPRPR